MKAPAEDPSERSSPHPSGWDGEVQAVFFDAAGTLISLTEPVGATYARLAAAHGILAAPEELEKAFRQAWKAHPQPQHGGIPPADGERGWWLTLVRSTFALAMGHPLPDSALQPLFEDLYRHYETAAAWQPYPDTVPALETIQGRYRLFVLSNFDQRLHRILENTRLAGYFEGVITSAQTGHAKPHPGIFTAAARLAHLPPAACLHIGDEHEADFLGAQAAHFQARHLTRPQSDLIQLLGPLLPSP
ncbi:MAG: HAD-IA family hydrolase [Prosthecobacter sp.]|jgi:putative hydrolase of the HAD superfamily|nr:HAD-IA family hydrolase [Prosthecobacter sp.]